MTRLAFLLLAISCGDGDDGDGDRPGGGNGDDTGDTDDGGGPNPELCADDVDNDGDGAIDCADSDCDAEFRCTWPDAVNLEINSFFQGNTITCSYLGMDFDVDVDDCTTVATSTMTETSTGNVCPACDRTYHGTLNYVTDSCSSLTGETPPTDGIFGFRFVDASTRQIWAVDETNGDWYMAGEITGSAGIFVVSGFEDVWDDPEDCDNGMQNLGRVTITMTFADL